MRFHIRLIRFIGVIVPGRYRSRFRREWEAELEYREAMLARWDRLTLWNKIELLVRSLGALWDAMRLQSHRMYFLGEDHMIQDLRYAVRMMLKHKGFMAVAVLTLALGIGANTAMFSVLKTYLFDALPYPESDRLVQILRTSPHSQSWPHSTANFLDHRKQNTVFESMAAYNYTSPNLAEPGAPAERLQALNTTADFFPTLGVSPALGRIFAAEEDQPDANRVAVLSDRFWQRRFGSDPKIIGKKITLDGQPVEIIGVARPGFEHPLLWGPVDLWRPIAFSKEQQADRNSNYLRSIGRLKPGVSIEQAQAAMVSLAANMIQTYSRNQGESIRLESLKLGMSDDIGRRVMWFAFGLAGFVVLIACANLANLQLARMTTRAREFAVRAALGAKRSRLLRQALTESLVVSFIGGLLSLLFATAGVRYISRRLFDDLPGAMVTLDYKVFGFALLASVLTGLLFGLVPAWLASRSDVNQALRENTRSATGGQAQRRLRNMLIIGEAAFALVLLTGAGLFLRGIQRFLHQQPGWRVDGLITAQLSVQGDRYKTPAQRLEFFERLEERLRGVAGIERVSISGSLPVFGFNSSSSFVVEGRPEPPPDKLPESFYEPVSREYFETLGARLIAGRSFTAQDKPDGPRVVMINETMARHFWPNESAIGKRIGDAGPNKNWKEIIGVVNDLSFPGSLGEPYTRYQAFTPMSQNFWGYAVIELRSKVAEETIAGSLRRIVADLDPSLPVQRIRTASQQVDQGIGQVSLLGVLLGAFASLGLALAAIGIYGVTAYSVAQRTGEIGIRMALGAQARNILWLILRRSATLTLIGAGLGVAGAYGAARLLAWAIPTLPTQDPVTFVALTLLLVVVALFAGYLPARRATRIDPMTALRKE